MMPRALEIISNALPVTYAYDALTRITANDTSARFWYDVGIVVGAIGLALILGAATLRRRTG
jgi:ABC-2 type transport system permease protein